MVEPVAPFERSVFNSFAAAPQSAPVDHLGLVETVDRPGQSPLTGSGQDKVTDRGNKHTN